MLVRAAIQIFGAWPSLERAVAGFTGANSPDLLQVGDKNLAVADLAGLGGGNYRIDNAFCRIVGNSDLNLGFRKKINDILSTAVELGVAALAPEPLDLADGHALYAHFAQGIADVVETKGFYNGSDKLHATGLQGKQAMPRMLAIASAYVYN